ncbi:MAG TPA: metallophosphoesterase [Candidatus Hydrogenedentes bacterium]|nr:metallophosphoesterase [Candidatus Hydrogenedentota bacterium]
MKGLPLIVAGRRIRIHWKAPVAAVRFLCGLSAMGVMILLAAETWAREPDGTLGLIRAPHNGRPALVGKTSEFDVMLREKADLRIEVGGSPVPLAVQWREMRGIWHGRCRLPDGVAEGGYTLEAVAGDKTDRNVRSVFVYASFPESYRFAQLTDIHIGAQREWGNGADIFRKAVETVNASNAAFAALTGDLTHDATPEQYAAFIEVLDTCTLPTFLCPGNHDRGAGDYDRVFGETVYTFNFGPDAYLSYDTKDYVIADEWGAQNGELELLRRAMRPARWSIGLTHRYDVSMGMRAQLALFVDCPLDHLVFGHWHRENKEGEKAVPWGATPFTVTPAAIDGYWRLFEISANGIKPEPPRRFLAVP